jgi:hypothetical protein
MWVPQDPDSQLALVNFGNTATHPFNVAEILKRVHLISNVRMRDMVIAGLTGYWDSHYEGPRGVFRDDSLVLNKEDQEKVYDKIVKEVKAGWTVGPFRDVPFPNEWCDSQALIMRLFTIAKHKWTPEDEERRVITHASFPPGISINDETGRHIPGVQYYTVQMFLSKVARAGKGALVSLVDVMHAYKNVLLNPADWHQQVLKVYGLYYVQMRGCFGSVAAGDNWILFVSAIVEIVRKVLRLGGRTCGDTTTNSGLDVYVDNFDLVVPGRNGVPQQQRADREHACVMKLVGEVFRLPLHEEHKPSTMLSAHLGWQVDTMRRMVGTTSERLLMMLALLSLWARRKMYKAKELDSLIGLVGFLACVIPGLITPLRYLRECKHKNFPHRKVGRVCNRLRYIVAWIKDFLTRWKGETRLYDMEWGAGPTIMFRTDASVAPASGGKDGAGCGAWSKELAVCMAWTVQPEVLAEAMRAVKASVPWLELYCIVVALHTHSSKLAGQRVMIYSDTGQPDSSTSSAEVFQQEPTYVETVAPSRQGCSHGRLQCTVHCSVEGSEQGGRSSCEIVAKS